MRARERVRRRRHARDGAGLGHAVADDEVAEPEARVQTAHGRGTRGTEEPAAMPLRQVRRRARRARLAAGRQGAAPSMATNMVATP